MPQAARQQQQSPSPSTLLWAYQIKREHAFLMNRVKDVEALTAEHEQHIKNLNDKPKPASSGEISALALQVQNMAQTQNAAAEQITRDLNAKMDTIQTENEALTIKISTLDSMGEVAEKERDIYHQTQTKILGQIAELDANLNKYVASLQGLKQTINDRQAQSVAAVVKDLRQEVQHNGLKMTDYLKKMEAIQQANKMLAAATTANEKKLVQLQADMAAARDDKARKVSRGRGRPPSQSKGLGPRTLPGDLNALRNITAVRKAQRPAIATPRPRIGPQKLTNESVVTKPRRGRPPLHKSTTPNKISRTTVKTPSQKVTSQAKARTEYRQHDDSLDASLASISFLVRKDGVTERPKGTACKPCARAHKRCTHGFSNDDLQASLKRLKAGQIPTHRPAVARKPQFHPKPKVPTGLKTSTNTSKPPVKRKVPVHERWVYVEEPAESETESGSDESHQDEDGYDRSARTKKRKSEAQRLKSSAKKLLADLSEGTNTRRSRHPAPVPIPVSVSEKETGNTPTKRPRGRPRKYPKIVPDAGINEDVGRVAQV